jgi:hypothetical protein
VERAFEGRNISARNEITELSPKFKTLRFAVFGDSFDNEIVVRYVLRVKWSGKSV